MTAANSTPGIARARSRREPPERDRRRELPSAVGSRDVELLRIESSGRSLQRDEAANQQAEADQQHERQGHLRDDQHAPRAPRARAAAHCAAGVAEALGEIDARRLERRRKPEREAGDQRCEQAEPQHSSIDADGHALGNVAARDREQPQRVHRPPRQQRAGHAAGEEQQHVLDQQLADEARAARAKRGANDAFPASRHRACQHQVGDVDAGDQHDQADGAEHQEKAAAGLTLNSGVVLVERHEAKAAILVRGGILGGELVRNRVQFCLGAGEGHAGPKARERVQIAIGAIRCVIGGDERLQEIRAIAHHVRRQHADDRGRLPIDRERLANDARIGGQAAPPVRVGQDDDAVPARLCFFRQESTAEDRRDTERGEPVSRHERAKDTLPRAGVDDLEIMAIVGGNLLERRVAAADIEKIEQ